MCSYFVITDVIFIIRETDFPNLTIFTHGFFGQLPCGRPCAGAGVLEALRPTPPGRAGSPAMETGRSPTVTTTTATARPSGGQREDKKWQVLGNPGQDVVSPAGEGGDSRGARRVGNIR